MAEPIRIPVPNKDYYAWPYEGQTQIKHKVFGAYWRIWVAKLGRFNNTMFMDCHGGCGAYIDGDKVYYGSSIIADAIATDVNSKSDRKYKNYICVCEIDPDNVANLEKVWIDQHCSKNRRIKNQDFNEVIFEQKIKDYYTTHPTLFLIDPFGYDLKMANMVGLMGYKGSEIIINFMFDHMNRFLSVEATDQQRDEYFGSTDWRKALSLNGHDREMFLVKLYKDSLKKNANAKFVFAYKLSYPDKNQTYYYLIHATNNIEGITHMKNSFASVNNGRIEYLGKRQNEMSLFDLSSYKTMDLAATALSSFVNKTMTFESVWEAIVEDVPYLEKDLSEAIQQLEDEGKLVVERVSSKRARYKGQDLIKFGANL